MSADAPAGLRPSANIPGAALLPGLGLTLLLAALATLVGASGWMTALGLSTLTIAIVLGMLVGNTVYRPLDAACQPGVIFSKGTLLRAGIVLYGLRLTVQQLLGVGGHGLAAAALMLVSTFMLAQVLGRWLNIDRETTALIGAGSSICGAAAVLATEPVVRARAGQVTVAVATVVVFGTLGIFLYPAMNALHLWPFSGETFGIYIGSSVHEVAQVVAAGKAIGPDVADAAVTTKMIRVMLLAPFLMLLAVWWRPAGPAVAAGSRASKITVPWFVLGFVAVALFNSLHLLPTSAVAFLLGLDTLLLTMAMAALGLSTQVGTLRQAGMKPMLLAALLMLWLVVGGGLLELLLGRL